jgi:anti-sigma regulatory factor (Ser/Thr protein kinase)
MNDATPLYPPNEHILVHQRLTVTPEAASRARRLIRAVDCPNLDIVALLTSELVTNVVRHSGSRWLDLMLGLRADGNLHLQVVDEGRGRTTPHLRRVDHDDVAGRGLHLVNDCSVRWGFMMDFAGMTVWCDIGDDPRFGVDSGDDGRMPDGGPVTGLSKALDVPRAVLDVAEVA